jgi:hypothetical protein
MGNVRFLDKIGPFIERFRSFAQQASDLRLERFTDRFGHVRTALEALADLDRRCERQLASRFNLFRVLQVERREVQTHSAFLAELFRPDGTHGQGTMFLDAFLQYCSSKGGEFKRFPRLGILTDPTFWEVDCEKPVPEGRLDIVVQSPQLKFLMALENKIGGAEQEDQIRRYQSWLDRRQEYPSDRRVLIYLTPDGRAATTASRQGYFRFSYAKDVVAWLQSALLNVEAPRVRDAVSQYLDLIRTLFHFAAEEEL